MMWTAGTVVNFVPAREDLPSAALKYRVLCEGLFRMARCGYVGVGIVRDYKSSGLDDDSSQEEWDIVHTRSAQKLVELAETNGALYVKCGQGFAQMNHLLPRAYCKVMASLEDSVSFRPISEIKAVLERELGAKLDDVFQSFNELPLAAASLAQVHKATLRETGQEVAVKVQYIDVADRFDGDMFTIRTCLKICGWLFPGYDFGALMMKGDRTLRAELDFVNEAKNSERCRAEMHVRFGSRVTTPVTIWPYTTAKVLVTEYIHGVKMTDAAGIRRLGLSVDDAATTFVEAMAHQAFHTGFVHADPHAGNVFVRPVPGSPRSAQIVLLDHGLYTQLTSKDVTWLASVWTAATERDDFRLQQMCVDAGVDAGLYKILAALFLQFPYESFNPFKIRASPEELERMRNDAHRQMAKYTDLLEALPIEYGLVLRNINAVRSVVKELGNPVRRTAIMLRHSVIRSDQHVSWIVLQWTLLRLRVTELYNDMLLSFARWKAPELMGAAEDLFTLG